MTTILEGGALLASAGWRRAGPLRCGRGPVPDHDCGQADEKVFFVRGVNRIWGGGGDLIRLLLSSFYIQGSLMPWRG